MVPITAAERPPSQVAVANELERIAASHSFRKAERCMRLLRYLCQSALEGRASELKEYTLGINVFDRPDSFDPRVDPVVRLEARRLRLKLAEYYQQEGLDDPVVIDIPKGAYVPYFRLRRAPQPDAPVVAAAKPSFHTWFGAAAALICISLIAAYLLRRPAPRPVVRASIAVLGFRDLSGRAETSWMAPAASELMEIELGAGQQLRTLPPENVARMRRELSITPDSTYSAQLLRRIGTNLDTDYAVAGAYLPQGDRVRLDVVLFDLHSGQQIAALGDESDRDKLAALAQDCARRLRAQLGVRLSSAEAAAAYPPAEPAAMEAYARGIERLRQSDALNACPYLERAATLAPSNPLVHSGLAAAWTMLGLDQRALKEAKQAFESSESLGRVEQLEIEGRYREIAHDWARAIQVYQALFTLLPDDLEYGLLLAHAQTSGGKAHDALATVSALRHSPSPVRDDPRIDLAEAQSAGALGDFPHTRSSAHAAAEKARRHGAMLQYARARLLESGAMQNLDIAGYPEVRAEARGICAELGDRACVAAAFRIEANALASTGSPAKARPIYATVLQISSEIGNQLEKLNALIGIAYTENTQGDLGAAEADYRAALAVASEIGQMKRYPVCLNLAEVLAAEGRIVDSRALGEEALEGARQSRDQESIGLGEAILARGLALEGKFPDSLAGYHESIRILRDLQEPGYLTLTLLDFGDAQLQTGDIAGARKSYDEARDLDKHHAFAGPEVELALARLGLASGQAEDAAAHARTALDTFTAAGRDGVRLQAAALLARALLARGNIDAASGVLALAPSPEGRTFPIEAAVEFRIARCMVEANTGRRGDACKALDTVAAELSRRGLPPLERETRLAREEVMKTARAVVPR